MVKNKKINIKKTICYNLFMNSVFLFFALIVLIYGFKMLNFISSINNQEIKLIALIVFMFSFIKLCSSSHL